MLFCNYLGSVLRFRGALLQSFVEMGYEVVVASPAGPPEIAERLRAMGVTYTAVRMNRAGTGPLGEFLTFLRIVKLVKALKPDILLNYTAKPAIYGSLAAKFTGVKNIYSVVPGLGHVFSGSSFRQRVLTFWVSWLYRTTLPVNKAVFFLNPDDRKLFCARILLKCREKAVLLDGEGVDLAHYRSSGMPAERNSFLLIGRLLVDKGILEYVRAAEILKNRYPGAVFKILGPADVNPSAIPMATVQKWVRSGVIEYLGEKQDVRPYIDQCGVYVLPSYREGLPASVLEAMAMGRPIITTDVPGCRETVRDGYNGFVVPVKNAEALAAAMEKFILKQELVQEMGRRGREIAEARYDVRKVNSVILRHMRLTNEAFV